MTLSGQAELIEEDNGQWTISGYPETAGVYAFAAHPDNVEEIGLGVYLGTAPKSVIGIGDRPVAYPLNPGGKPVVLPVYSMIDDGVEKVRVPYIDAKIEQGRICWLYLGDVEDYYG